MPEIIAPGEEIGSRYAIHRELGRGGCAVVFLGHDSKLDRRVAIKVLRAELAASVIADRFLTEIRLTAQFSHPNILPLLDTGEVAGIPFYVMPFVEEETLRQRLVRERQLPIQDAIQIARDVADAVEYAHQRQVVHRDIKPENILLNGPRAVVADFGVARAIAGAQRLTSTGLAVGTPAYMSPEQASGWGEIDGRSDVYALGCTLYEMLAGQPPFAAATADALVRRHLAAPPPSVRAARPDVSHHLDQVILTCLAKSPAERFPTASALSRALGAPSAVHWVLRLRRWKSLLRAAAVALVIAAAGFVFARSLSGPKGGLDVSRMVVIALPSLDSVLGAEATVMRLSLHSAASRIPALDLEGSVQVEDRLGRIDGPPGFDDYLGIARELGAGRLLVAGAVASRDSAHVELQLYRTSDRVTEAHHAGVLPLGESGIDTAVTRLVEAMFELPTGSLRWAGSLNAGATVAYAEGRELLERHWDLEAAESKLRDALALDPDYPNANLALAEIGSWSNAPVEEWLPFARRAALGASKLTILSGASSARGLVALGEGDFAAACDEYAGMLAADSSDFRAWFGLGECLSNDRTVERDSLAPFGWRFRTSAQAAAHSYTRALQLVPSFNFAFRGEAYSRLSPLLFAAPHGARYGFAAEPDTGLFVARMTLDHDTVAFFPAPAAQLATGQASVDPTSEQAALKRGRTQLLSIMTMWSTAFPSSGDAHFGRAVALEALGRIEGAESALEEVRTARRSAGLSEPLGAATTEVRLLIKAERFEEARSLADSLLTANTNPNEDTARWLSGIAALVGRVHLTADIMATAAPILLVLPTGHGLHDLPLRVLSLRERYHAYAIFGGPVDTLSAIHASLVDALRVLAPGTEEDHQELMQTLLGDIQVWAYADIGRSQEHRPDAMNYLMRLQWELSEGDTTAVREGLLALMQQRSSGRPGDVSIGNVYHEARMLLAVGDTNAAEVHLQQSLDALSTHSRQLVTEPVQAASLVRAMLLRADLASQRNDSLNEMEWRTAVRDLWNRGATTAQPH